MQKMHLVHDMPSCPPLRIEVLFHAIWAPSQWLGFVHPWAPFRCLGDTQVDVFYRARTNVRWAICAKNISAQIKACEVIWRAWTRSCMCDTIQICIRPSFTPRPCYLVKKDSKRVPSHPIGKCGNVGKQGRRISPRREPMFRTQLSVPQRPKSCRARKSGLYSDAALRAPIAFPRKAGLQ